MTAPDWLPAALAELEPYLDPESGEEGSLA